MKGALTVALVVSWAAVALPANAQWLDHRTPNLPRTSDGKPNLAAPPPRAADGHIESPRPRAGGELLQRPARVQLSAQRARADARLEAHPPDAVAHRDRLRQPDLPLHLHGRPQARSRSGAHVDGVLRGTVGRRHAGGGQLWIQRSHV